MRVAKVVGSNWLNTGSPTEALLAFHNAKQTSVLVVKQRLGQNILEDNLAPGG
jgi:hypothetical protein